MDKNIHQTCNTHAIHLGSPVIVRLHLGESMESKSSRIDKVVVEAEPWW